MTDDAINEVALLLAQFAPKKPTPFPQLHPHADLIRALREKGASFDTIEAILRSKGITVSDTTIRRFCRAALQESPDSAGRRTRKASRIPKPQSTQQENSSTPTNPISPNSIQPPSAPTATAASSGSASRERISGPRVANIRMAQPDKT
jgi:hypothetical protein